jgi:hypothetical protein
LTLSNYFSQQLRIKKFAFLLCSKPRHFFRKHGVWKFLLNFICFVFVFLFLF